MRAFYSNLIKLVLLTVNLFPSISYRVSPKYSRSLIARQCIGKDLTPVKQVMKSDKLYIQSKLFYAITTISQPEGAIRRDSDTSWQTPPSSIVPCDFDKDTLPRPTLITFSKDVLIEPSQSVGRWYREALNSACDMQIRLPRPAYFTKAFNKAYKEM